MSLTGVSPLIADWMRLKLKWMYHFHPVQRPFTIPAGREVRVPFEDYVFTAPEGTIFNFGGLFDDPSCGIKLEAHPELETGLTFTVSNAFVVGTLNAPWFFFGMVPPQVAPGTYGILNYKEWPWTEWMRISVFNPDSVPHTCLGYGYTIATLQEPRPDDSILPLVTIKKMQLAFEMFPEAREPMRRKLAEKVDGWLDELKVKNVKLQGKVAD